MDLSKMKKEELLEKATALNIDVTEKMTKKELLSLLENVELAESEPIEEKPSEAFTLEPREATQEEIEIIKESKEPIGSSSTRRSRRSGRSINRTTRSTGSANKTKDDNSFRDLSLSVDRHMKKVLRGTVYDVRGPFKTEDGEVNMVALVTYGTQLVIIPGHEFLQDWESLNTGQKAGYMRERIHQPIEFVALEYKAMEGREFWIASRTQAMEKVRRNAWFKRLPGGEYDIKAGDIREGVVTCVLRDSCFIEYKGVERRVKDSELTYEYLLDANEEFSPGDVVRFKILSIERDGEDIKTEFSVKQTVEDPMNRFVEDVHRGDHIGGEVRVSRVTPKGARVYVIVRGRGTIMCDIAGTIQDAPNPGDLVSLIVTGKSKPEAPKKWIWGTIYRVFPQNKR